MTNEDDEAMSDAFSVDIEDLGLDEDPTPKPVELTEALMGIVQLLELFTLEERMLVLSEFDRITGKKKDHT